MNTPAVHNIPTRSSQKQQAEKHVENMQPTRSMATVASNGATKSNAPHEWIVVGQKSNNTKKDNVKVNLSESKTKFVRRIILMQHPGTKTEINPLLSRNTINSAFAAKVIKGPVVNVVAKTNNNNISITTTEDYPADFFLDEKDVWEEIIPHKTAQKDVPWYKVLAHGILLADF